MKKHNALSASLLSATILALTACAGLPPTETLAGLPVVRYGQPAPSDGDYILHYPAGEPLQVDAAVTGDLFIRDERATLTPRLKQDVYVFDEWASFDGKHWARGTDLVGGAFSFVLPGHEDSRSPGKLHAEFHAK